jgi:hypothetical protein
VRAAAFLLAGTLAAGLTLAHVRLQTGSGTPLAWPSPNAIPIVINATGSADIADGSHFTALRNAFDAWNDVAGSTVELVENTAPAQQARTDHGALDINLVLFDETNASGYFSSPGTVAVTPVFYNPANGVIASADVLFNGLNHSFTTCKSATCVGGLGSFDVQDVAAHELGHLLGLDHSGWAGATMYPYVDPSVVLHRSLGLDDANGMREAYPSTVYAALLGTVRRASDNSVVAGASVVVRDINGRTAGSTLSRADGTFALRGLQGGIYDLWATPLDFPVSAANLGGGLLVQTDFESTYTGVYYMLDAGDTMAIGNVLVDADVGVSLGRNLDDFPLRCIEGQTAFLILRGSGLNAGSTLTASDPNLTVNVTSWLGTQVNFQIGVPAGALPGHADLLVTDSGGNQSLLPSALEITPADPTVSGVAPPGGSELGGTALTISGTGFQPGARVVIGPRIYVDGEPGGCTVVNATTITLTTQATPLGSWDVVVVDPTGVEGRRLAAFTSGVLQVDSVFPTAGQQTGGTLLTLRGKNFQSGAVVRIDGVQQGSVTFVDPTRLSVTTNAYVAGGPYVLEVENPDLQVASAAFAYVAQSDPALATVDPVSGPAGGGQTLTLGGASFGAVSEVVFGADPETGLGGAPGTGLVVLDPATIQVVTPARAPGAASVLVRTPQGQASVVAAAFTFVGDSGGGGGGGCSVAPASGGPREPFEGAAGWLAPLAAFLLLALRARRRAAPAENGPRRAA